MFGKMKGDEEPEMTIGTIIFIGGLLFIFGIVFLRFTEFNAVIKNDMEQIEMMNAVHFAKKCFERDGFVQEAILTPENKEDCKISAKICVRDMESNKEWLDCSDADDPVHTIHAPLATINNKIHFGEISVEK